MRPTPWLAAALFALAGCTTPASASAPHTHERTATLLFFSDAHADLETHPELFWQSDGRDETVMAGGYARMAHAARAIRDETGGRALLVDGGDTFQGSAAATWSRGEVVLAPQRALGVDVGIPGNWEVVYGAARMRELAAATGYPWLATNVVDAATGQLVFRPWLVREVGGLRVGFVGFTDPDVPLRQSPSYSAGLRFLGAESIAPAVREVRAQGADVVVLVTHIGLARSVALADRLEGVDVILSGDTHERVETPIERHGVVVVEPGSFASFLGRLDVHVRPGARPRFDWQLIELRADRVPEDPGMAAVVRGALAPYRQRLDAVIGTAAAPLERYGVVETTADDVLVDAIRWETGADIALSNGFRFAHPILAGPITEGDLGRLYPVNGNLKIGHVTGKQLRAFWESELEHVFATDASRLFGGWVPRVSGMRVRFRAYAPAGHRVESIEVGGAPVDDAATYTVASCEREGDTPDTVCRMRGLTDVRTLDIDVHTAVRHYLARRSPVGGPLAASVIATDLPPRVYSQYLRR